MKGLLVIDWIKVFLDNPAAAHVLLVCRGEKFMFFPLLKAVLLPKHVVTFVYGHGTRVHSVRVEDPIGGASQYKGVFDKLE